jgi:hypothetical protein
MAWWTELFRSVPKKESSTHENAVPLSTVLRWYLYDTALVELEEVNDMAEALGLSRISSEGEDMELAESYLRVSEIEPLLPFLESMADMSAQLLTAVHIKEALEQGTADDTDLAASAEKLTVVYKAIALSTLVGTMSSAVYLGLVNHNTVKTNVESTGDYYE